MSITKSQALAVADGFLDTLGTGSPDDLQPRETMSELVLLASEFIEDSQSNLIASNSVASGELSASLEAGEPATMGTVVKIDIVMLPYGLFVNAGVKGTKGGSSTAGYSFKTDMPASAKKDPNGMVAMIQKWIDRGKMSTSNTSAKKSISKNEIKNATIGSILSAYAVARSIKQKGLKATGFLDKAEATTSAKVEDRLGAALEIDIITSISQ